MTVLVTLCVALTLYVALTLCVALTLAWCRISKHGVTACYAIGVHLHGVCATGSIPHLGIVGIGLRG